VSRLAPLDTTTVLSSLRKSGIQFDANDIAIQFGTAQDAHGLERVASLLVLDETKPARRFLDAIQSHVDRGNGANLSKVRAHETRRCREGQVTDVEGGTLHERGNLGLVRIVVTAVPIQELHFRIVVEEFRGSDERARNVQAAVGCGILLGRR